MTFIVTIDGKHEYRIEAETQAVAEALAVRYFNRDHGVGAPNVGRVTGTRPE